ncbi:hypothetical protein QYM36_014907 [Artemia franciscana]|uniref:Reverse transcriptase domain-containing protein n=1 Tax=Artemia franciscana TaxID=6661 RepID=A0AA88KU43_ARTSF|nr:hypothetical protein QYM36_014907 [Artemia franciscana]
MELSQKFTNSPKQMQCLRVLYAVGAERDLTNPVTVISATRDAANVRKKGNIAAACRSKPENVARKVKYKCKVRHVAETEKSEEEKTDSASAPDLKQPTNEDNWTILSIRGESPEIIVALTIGQSKLDFELDTAAAESLISEQTYRNCLSSVKLKKYDRKLIAYGGHDIPTLGEVNVKVTYKSQSKTIMNEFSELFSENLGKVKRVKAHLNLKSDAKPKFFKARVVPLAIREKVELELNRLVKIGELEKVDYSDWASPLVPVNKPNGSVRICGDFKATFNPSLNPTEYPIPTAEEIFTNLQGGQKFSKLDLNAACLQIELDDESKELATINTPLGLYRYKRLPFGISESGAIFQETLDKILSGIPAAHIVDDLRDFGIRLNPDKCEFFADKVEYFSFVLSAKGIEPNPRKVEANMNMPRPRNRNELLSFLGDAVLVRDYANPDRPVWVKGVILKCVTSIIYLVKVNDYVWKRHIDQMPDCTIKDLPIDTDWQTLVKGPSADRDQVARSRVEPRRSNRERKQTQFYGMNYIKEGEMQCFDHLFLCASVYLKFLSSLLYESHANCE